MIWTRGEIRAHDDLTIPVNDRTFEHGLGLFETFRTWRGRPSTLEAHRARMLRSASALGLRIEPDSLPDAGAVARLLASEGAVGDQMIRVTASGGVDSSASTVWMRSGPLPPPTNGASVLVGSWRVVEDDPMARHKALNYWARRIAHGHAVGLGFDEALGLADRTLREGSRSNLFAIRDETLMTPSLEGPIVPGVMRALVLESARRMGLPVVEVEGIDPDRLGGFDELFLSNAVRGIIPVARAARPGGPEISWPAPGPISRRLMDSTARWLERGDWG